MGQVEFRRGDLVEIDPEELPDYTGPRLVHVVHVERDWVWVSAFGGPSVWFFPWELNFVRAGTADDWWMQPAE